MGNEQYKPDTIRADQWILNEAAGDSELADLIARRESLFVEADIEGGMMGIYDETAALKMKNITFQIEERKKRLGIDPSVEP